MIDGHTPGRGFYLTDTVRNTICAAIRAGAYAHVAAGAAGISMRTFNAYTAANATSKFHESHKEAIEQFQAEVEQAKMQARLAAETKVAKSKPLEWLRYGPGREKPGNPGWTETSRVELTGKDGGPIEHQIVALDLKNCTQEELDGLERLSAKLAGISARGSESGEGAP